MAKSSGNTGLWIAGIAGVIAIGTWLALGGPQRAPDDSSALPDSTAPAVSPAAAVEQAATPPELTAKSGQHRIAAGGRLAIDRADLENEAALAVDLELADDARGTGERTVRVVSTDGRRIDLTATPLPGTGTGVHLNIDAGFLTPGRYLVEIDTVDDHPLKIRRYVVEIR